MSIWFFFFFFFDFFFSLIFYIISAKYYLHVNEGLCDILNFSSPT